MIKMGNMIILETRTATFSPCRVVRQDQSMVRNEETGKMEAHLKSVTVSFLAGMVRNRKTGKMEENWKQETVLSKDITKMQEMI
jgi:hypothetical protein